MTGLPKGWANAKLGEIASYVTSGSRDWSKYYSNEGALFVRTQDINRNTLAEPEAIARVALPDRVEGKRTLIAQDDILITITGANVGKCAHVGEKLPEAYVSQSVALVRLADAGTAAFLQKQLIAPADGLAGTLLEGRAYGLGRPVLSLDNVRELPIRLAPIREQRRIVAKLDALTARTARARADLDCAQQLAATYRKAILASALSGSLTAQWRKEHEELWADGDLRALGERRRKSVGSRRGSRLRDMPPLLLPGSAAIPSWASGCVADVADLIVGYAFKSEWFSSEGPLLMRGANVAVGHVSWDDAKRLRPDLAGGYAEYVLHEGDIVLAMDRPLISGGLKIAQVSKEDDGSLLVQRVACPRPTSLVNRRYLWWVLNSEALIGQIERHASGSDLPHISSNDILATPMRFPPLAEQVEIARLLDCAFAEISRLISDAAAARRLVDRLDQAILAKAFRGELVPQDPADEPASALLDRIRAERAAAPLEAKRGRKPKAA